MIELRIDLLSGPHNLVLPCGLSIRRQVSGGRNPVRRNSEGRAAVLVNGPQQVIKSARLGQVGTGVELTAPIRQLLAWFDKEWNDEAPTRGMRSGLRVRSLQPFGAGTRS